jgi:hypothetical protein
MVCDQYDVTQSSRSMNSRSSSSSLCIVIRILIKIPRRLKISRLVFLVSSLSNSLLKSRFYIIKHVRPCASNIGSEIILQFFFKRVSNGRPQKLQNNRKKCRLYYCQIVQEYLLNFFQSTS